MYESIFDDGRCGCWHTHICLLYLQLMYCEAHSGGSMQKVMEYFDKAFDHYKKYQLIYEQLEKGEKYTYSAPLVSSLQVGKGGLAPLASNFWKQEFRPLRRTF